MKTANILFQRIAKLLLFVALPIGGVGGSLLFTSCEDFFDQESDHVIYSETDHLSNWSDTVYSVMGILNKLQAISDRTILLGEVRGDLVTLTDNAASDLRDMANFQMSSENAYNQPRDYYAIINNCNYFLDKVKKDLKSNRNEYIFMKEYAAVKAIRAWTYLQLVLNYGSVPFITEPILTKEESERDYPRKELADICDFFLQDLSDIPTLYDRVYPGYGTNVRSNDSRFFFFPLNLLRGDLSLWLGSTKGREAGRSDFENAARYYYKFITERNGIDTYFTSGIDLRMWMPGSANWTSHLTVNNLMSQYSNETWSGNTELITLIPGDSIRAEGYYSELRNLFNSTTENSNKFSITPSRRLIEISESQVNCVLTSDGKSGSYAPTGLSDYESGDLRLSTFWSTGTTIDVNSGQREDYQYIRKYATRNVHIYRRQMVYLRFAEALNLSGQPRMAFKVLESGLSDTIIKKDVLPYLSDEDSTWVVSNFKFLDNRVMVLNGEDFGPSGSFANKNMVGIHTRGSGWTPYNEYYRLKYENQSASVMQPDSSFVFDASLYARMKETQQAQVDSLLLNEEALEMCFEGYRFYDLMRFAMRSDNPGAFMVERLNARGGEGTTQNLDALNDPHNWYLKWNGKIGY